MSFLKKLKGIFSKDEQQEGAMAEKEDPFQKRFRNFQKLLAGNNTVLESMADMEEKLTGEYLFDRKYLETGIQKIENGVQTIIVNLNAISGNKYSVLNERFTTIKNQLDGILSKKREIQKFPYTISFQEINAGMSDNLGSKSANLGEIKSRTSLPAPDGFAISSYAFKQFMDRNRLIDSIAERLAGLPVDDFEKLQNISAEIRAMIIKADVPAEIVKEILDSYAKLCDRQNSKTAVSVRSSALQEDSEFSFAGQYSTSLNVSADTLVQKYKEVIASLFNERALFYYKTKGFEDFDMAMPVSVVAMIDARAAGVIYSRDPNDPKSNSLIVSSARGIGKSVVDGMVTPETYIVSRSSGHDILEKRIPDQTSMVACKPGGGVESVSVNDADRGKPSLSDHEVKTLSGYALVLEEHFGSPQDIEWAIDRKNKPYILQSRPLRLTAKELAKPVPRRVEGFSILIDKGVIACKGIGFGPAHIVRTDDDLKDFPDGGILVARRTSTKFVTVMNRASAIITDIGASTGHMASLAREFRVPTLLDTEKATALITGGQYITVDAVNCNVYDGKVEALAEFADRSDDEFRETALFRTLEKSLKVVAPLHLYDPDAETFTPENCLTYHDITRFCHEMAVRELFDVVDTSADDVGAMRLVAGIPMEVYLLDLGGGLSERPKFLNPEHISSVPFASFLKGLMSMRWPEARAFDVQGFLGAVAHTATISEEEIQKMAERSFSFISKDYMNFAIRLGYHLSTVEAYATDTVNDNYIRFFFKGGGAVLDRRLRRIRLIREILKALDFNVKFKDDVLEASVTKYKKDLILQTLEIMGRFTVYTKQLDMVMYNDLITDHYIEEFCRQYIPKKG